MFSEDYYADLESVPRRWSRELTRYWLRAAAFAIPIVIAVLSLFVGVSGFLAGSAIAAYGIAIRLSIKRLFPVFSGRIGFLCGYSDCGRLISPLYFWQCPYCDHIPKHLDVNGKDSYFGTCKACGRKPFTITCPHCQRPLP